MGVLRGPSNGDHFYQLILTKTPVTLAFQEVSIRTPTDTNTQMSMFEIYNRLDSTKNLETKLQSMHCIALENSRFCESKYEDICTCPVLT